MLLSEKELSIISSLVDFLSNFKSATEIVEGYKYPTLPLVGQQSFDHL